MRRIFGFLFIVFMLAFAAPTMATAPPDNAISILNIDNQTAIKAGDAFDRTGPTYKLDQAAFDKGATQPAQPALIETSKLIDGIVIAQADPEYRPVGAAIATVDTAQLTIAHKTANGPCKDVVPRRDGKCIVIDAHHSPGPCTA